MTSKTPLHYRKLSLHQMLKLIVLLDREEIPPGEFLTAVIGCDRRHDASLHMLMQAMKDDDSMFFTEDSYEILDDAKI